MSQAIKLVGFDCGSTTTSAVVAAARLTHGALGRVEITDVEPVFHSPSVLTPFDDERIDQVRLVSYLDEWLAAAQTPPGEIFAGGALITGLAAQRANASAIARSIETRLADALIATANDPRLESWLAFMGNCHALSRSHPTTPVLNVDIGGGTTNLAWGVGGQVTDTGSLFAAARHFEFQAGTYRLTRLSAYSAELLTHLKIDRGVGETLSGEEVAAILDFYSDLIAAAADGDQDALVTPIAVRHVQAMPKFSSTPDPDTLITLSGGVGQLVYDHLRGRTEPGATRFGDLGGELAARIASTPAITNRMGRLAPEGLGRATVYGLMRHSTELSGSTLYLPHPERLPLANVPLVGRFGPATSDAQLAHLLDLAAHSEPAACLQWELDRPTLDVVRSLGERLARLLAARPWPSGHSLVLLVPANFGKALGNYVTRWSTLEVDVIVIDEVPLGEAQFVRLGRAREGVVPLWLYSVR